MNLFSVSQCSGGRREILVLQRSLVASATCYMLQRKTAEFTYFKVNTNQSSLLLYWQSVIIQQSVNYGNKISNTNRQTMLEISKQSSITNTRNTQTHVCTALCEPPHSWAVGVKKTPPLPKDCRFPCLHVSCGICGSFTFLQIPAVPYKSWAEPHMLETVVSFPRSVLSFHTSFIFLLSLAPAFCQVFL